MNTKNFTQLIRAITGRNFTIEKRTRWRETEPAGETLSHETLYFVGLTLPITGSTYGFDWKTPKADEKMLRSFITAFSSKYREPNPASYRETICGARSWEQMSPEKREWAFGHHASHMFSKETLLEQVQERFACPEIETALNQWGFYETEYGIGIFCFWETPFVRKAIENMRQFLTQKSVATREEYSDARWVYRFRVEASREIHVGLLKEFCSKGAAIG
jgi:hypothetical protein